MDNWKITNEVKPEDGQEVIIEIIAFDKLQEFKSTFRKLSFQDCFMVPGYGPHNEHAIKRWKPTS